MNHINNRSLLTAVRAVLEEHLEAYLEEVLGEASNASLSIRTFEEAGLLTDNQGLSITLGGYNGSRYQLSLLGSSRYESEEDSDE